jgi:hypothetical protein
MDTRTAAWLCLTAYSQTWPITGPGPPSLEGGVQTPSLWYPLMRQTVLGRSDHVLSALCPNEDTWRAAWGCLDHPPPHGVVYYVMQYTTLERGENGRGGWTAAHGARE